MVVYIKSHVVYKWLLKGLSHMVGYIMSYVIVAYIKSQGMANL